MSIAATSFDTEDLFGELSVQYALLGSANSVTNRDAKETIISGWEDLERDLLLSPAILHLNSLLEAIKKLRELKANWDSYGAPPPGEAVLRLADRAVRRAFASKNLPQTIVPSADGGVALCWDRNERHAYVEFDNDGGAVAVAYRAMNDPRIVEIKGDDTAAIDTQIEAIREFFS